MNFILAMFRIIKRSIEGRRFWTDCEHRYAMLIGRGYGHIPALLEISKQRHPELSDEVHERIVGKFPEIPRLANFIYHALDFQPCTVPTYGGRLTDAQALALLENTTVSQHGLVNTDFRAAKEIGLDTVKRQTADTSL